jgi:hypothetical protein
LHYVDQPHVVKTLQQVSWPVGAAGAAVAAAGAVNQSEDKTKTALKQAIVIGASLGGTALATHKLNFSELPALKTLSTDVFQTVSRTLGDDVAQLANKPKKTVGELKQLVTHLDSALHLPHAERHALKAAVLPAPELETDPMHEVKSFLKLGAASVGSGVVGGAAANALTGDKSQLPAQLKEGLFQMGVNIGMCGVGAASGIKAAEAMGHAASRLKRVGWIGGGLAAGIAGGNLVSNMLEKTVVDPVAKATGHPELAADPARQVHSTDLAMHLDDVPLMAMFAGVEAIKPVIPLCFLYSGIKSGTAAAKPQAATGNKVLPGAVVINQTFSGQPTHPAFQPFSAN